MAYPHPYGSDFLQIRPGLFKQGFNEFLHAVRDIYLFVRRKRCKIAVKKCSVLPYSSKAGKTPPARRLL